MHWIVVQVQPQKEDYAVQNLMSSGFRCYCPKILLQKAGKSSLVPMFRGYVFVEIDKNDVSRWKTIKSHRGVQRILGNASGTPAKLPDGFVERLIEHGNFVEEAHEPIKYEKGQKIVFTSGPFFGISGTVRYSNKERVALLVDLLGGHALIQASTQNIRLSGASCESGSSAVAINQEK